MELIVTNENFETEIKKSKIPVLVDFWATWCGPCNMIAPIVEEFAKENEEKILVAKANVDEVPDLADKFDIHFIPTIVVLIDGTEKARHTGLVTKEKLQSLIDEAKSK